MSEHLCVDCGAEFYPLPGRRPDVCEPCQDPYRSSYHRNCIYCAQEFMGHTPYQRACGHCLLDSRVLTNEEYHQAIVEQELADHLKDVKISADFKIDMHWNLPETDPEWII